MIFANVYLVKRVLNYFASLLTWINKANICNSSDAIEPRRGAAEQTSTIITFNLYFISSLSKQLFK